MGIWLKLAGLDVQSVAPSPPLDCFEKTIPTRQNKKRALTKSTSIAALTKSALFLPFFCCWRYCGIRDPSWAELHHFVNFLNSQLRDAEESIFCNTKLVGDLLQGFRTFVVRFLIEMSRVRLTIILDILFFWCRSVGIFLSSRNFIFQQYVLY